MAEPQNNGHELPSATVKSITVRYDTATGEINVSGCVGDTPIALGLLESGLLLVKEQ